jgi:hypothetical protein
MALDTLLNAGWLKQIQLYDIEGADEATASPRTDAAVQLVCQGFGGVSVIRAAWNMIAAGTQSGLVHVFDWDGSLKRTIQVGETAVSALLVTAGGLRAAYCAGRVTLFDGGRITGSTELPEYFAELGDCGTGVLAWRSKSVWLIEASGRVQLAAETDRPMRGVWGHPSGFYVLAGELASFRVRPTEAGRR